LAIASGIRTARLLPHFEIVDSFFICIYFEYTPGSNARDSGAAVRALGRKRPNRELEQPGEPEVALRKRGVISSKAVEGRYRGIRPRWE
jgi:hypothetical protein